MVTYLNEEELYKTSSLPSDTSFLHPHSQSNFLTQTTHKPNNQPNNFKMDTIKVSIVSFTAPLLAQPYHHISQNIS